MKQKNCIQVRHVDTSVFHHRNIFKGFIEKIFVKNYKFRWILENPSYLVRLDVGIFSVLQCRQIKALTKTSNEAGRPSERETVETPTNAVSRITLPSRKLNPFRAVGKTGAAR